MECRSDGAPSRLDRSAERGYDGSPTGLGAWVHQVWLPWWFRCISFKFDAGRPPCREGSESYDRPPCGLRNP
jgi:hypothetical protein